MLALVGGALMMGCGARGAPRADGVDRAFVDQMIPHHQLVIEMAADPATATSRPQLARLGASIGRSHQQQLTQMRAVARKLGVTPLSGIADGRTMSSGPMRDDTLTLGIPARDMNMTMNISGLAAEHPFDRVYIDTMIPYHQCEIRMARAELADGHDPTLLSIATRILATQPAQLRRMNAWRIEWYGSASPAGGVPSAST